MVCWGQSDLTVFGGCQSHVGANCKKILSLRSVCFNVLGQREQSNKGLATNKGPARSDRPSTSLLPREKQVGQQDLGEPVERLLNGLRSLEPVHESPTHESSKYKVSAATSRSGQRSSGERQRLAAAAVLQRSQHRLCRGLRPAAAIFVAVDQLFIERYPSQPIAPIGLFAADSLLHPHRSSGDRLPELHVVKAIPDSSEVVTRKQKCQGPTVPTVFRGRNPSWLGRAWAPARSKADAVLWGDPLGELQRLDLKEVRAVVMSSGATGTGKAAVATGGPWKGLGSPALVSCGQWVQTVGPTL